MGCTGATTSQSCFPDTLFLDCCSQAPASVPYDSKKEQNMSYNQLNVVSTSANESLESSQRSYLSGRASDIYYEQNANLQRTYGLADDEYPENIGEALDRIVTGKFVISDKDRTRSTYALTDYIRFRDPAVKEDSAGYKVASEALMTKWTAVRDSAQLDPIADAKKVLQKFESTTVN